MEELKFRAWDKKRNEMITDAIEYESRLLDLPSPKNEPINSSIGFFKDTDGRLFDVMQYTGKKDKKGIEIYDGDVLRWYPNKPVNHIDVIIGWNEYTASFYFGDWYDNDFPDTVIDSLVIGNIYQNPERGKIHDHN